MILYIIMDKGGVGNKIVEGERGFFVGIAAVGGDLEGTPEWENHSFPLFRSPESKKV